ncbi:WbqC family protein [Bacillus sp. FJAT-49736]|uniref:WbqC family protein n=1 Tax=Bacillus sp. FJAT-49736 TaxID=2833582 RepID=UPI001BC972B3|nr:WbqC family protein [Bacillus sp. FJAT-49736]MBS4172198.1 WbqC family protein [Bacillus sp. FJAT-49736]
MIVGIHQPNYLPWIGYFHKMLSCDVFVLLDDVLCSNKAERRNVIKGSNGIVSLSVPVINKKALIKDIQIKNELNWKHRHFNSLQGCYAKTEYWEQISPSLLKIYQHSGSKLIDINLEIIHFIRDYLGMKTPIVRSSELSGIKGKKNTKLINICKSLGADMYLSGNGAKSYIDENDFQNNNITIVYQEFEHPVYPQRWGKFIPNLSIIDLLLNCGPNSKNYLSKQIITKQ